MLNEPVNPCPFSMKKTCLKPPDWHQDSKQFWAVKRVKFVERTRDGTLSLSDRQISAVFSGRHDDMPSTSDMSPNLVKTKECSWVVGRLGMAEIVPGENNDFGTWEMLESMQGCTS